MKLSEFIKVYDNALPVEACRALREAFDSMAAMQQSNGAGIRPALEGSSWTELDLTRHGDIGVKALFLEQVQKYREIYSSELALGLPVSPVRRLAELIVKRYRPKGGDQFQLHYDSLGPVANRYLVFLWYLNDVSEGGETDFPDIGVKVTPKEGRLVIFPPYWMFQHSGLPPKSNDKYIISTYLLY